MASVASTSVTNVQDVVAVEQETGFEEIEFILCHVPEDTGKEDLRPTASLVSTLHICVWCSSRQEEPGHSQQ